MKCPHCFVTFDDQWGVRYIAGDIDAEWKIAATKCSACERSILRLRGIQGETVPFDFMVWPRGAARPVAPEVPESYAGDFREACVVLSDSTNASAAISRRCLQSLLVN